MSDRPAAGPLETDIPEAIANPDEADILNAVEDPAAAKDPEMLEDPATAGSPTGPASLAADILTETLVLLSTRLSELLRLRARDIDLADRLYAENTRLRVGEFNSAVAPLVSGLLRLNDQMALLADGDSTSVAGMLRTQLLQILDTAAGLSPFEPDPGEHFDATRHAGAGRIPTDDVEAEGTVVRSLKPGFVRADGSITRVAEVEVYRFSSR